MKYRDDKYFFWYMVRGKKYLNFLKHIDRKRLHDILDSLDEPFIYHRFKDFGTNYLDYLKDAKDFGIIKKIINVHNVKRDNNECILRYFFLGYKEWENN